MSLKKEDIVEVKEKDDNGELARLSLLFPSLFGSDSSPFKNFF